MYREGFEVVLFLQTLRLQVGSLIVLVAVLIGLSSQPSLGALTFVAHHRLPYKKMLVFTGVMLGVVFWSWLESRLKRCNWPIGFPRHLNWPIPDWMGLWFSMISTVKTLVAQLLAAVLVIGSYFLARYRTVWLPHPRGEVPAQRPEAPPSRISTVER